MRDASSMTMPHVDQSLVNSDLILTPVYIINFIYIAC